jgi:hypothetical protein
MGGALRIADLLQYVPMLYGPAVGVHLEDVNAGKPTVLRVVVEQIDEMDVCPDIVVDGDDPVDHDPQIDAILGDLVEEPGQLGCTIRNQRIVLNVFRREEFGHCLFSLFLVDHQIVEGKNVVLISNGADIIGVYSREGFLDSGHRSINRS